MPDQALKIDRKRSHWVVKTLLNAWRKKLPPYDHVTPVPSRLPVNLIRAGREEANYYLCCCYFMRGRINSGTALMQLARLHENEPWMFEPKNFLNKDGAEISELQEKIHLLLRDYGLGFNARHNSRFWVLNFQKLAKFWDSNLLNVFKKGTSWKKLLKIFFVGKDNPDSPTGFLCFREKMLGMIIYFLSRAFLIDPFAFPGVIDFHNNRVGLSTGMLVGEARRPGQKFTFEELGSLMRKIFSLYAPSPEDTLDLADALWHLSREFCSVNQGNSSHVSDKYDLKAAIITPKRIRWTAGAIKSYNSSCGLCPLEGVCTLSVPSADNYADRFIYIRMERPKPHRAQLQLLEVERNLRTRAPKIQSRISEEIPHKDQFSVFDD